MTRAGNWLSGGRRGVGRDPSSAPSSGPWPVRRSVGRHLRRCVLVATTLALLLPTVPSPAAARAGARLPDGVTRPDIVLLMLDDVAQIDDRLWSRLPTIRRLFLDSGLRFTDYIGNDPSCCPGRANVLTGQWSSHHGVVRNDARLFDPSESLATELQSTGYWTGIFGKYFNKTNQLADKSPEGWDRSFIFAGGYWDYIAYADGVAFPKGTSTSEYSTIQVRRQAVDALNTAPVDQPRLVWLAPFAIHIGTDQLGSTVGSQPAPAPQDVGAAACADVPPWSTAANLEQDLATKPAYLQQWRLMPKRALVRSCEALLSVDRMLKAVLATFEAQGRPEPMVILTADNGMAWGAHHWRSKFVPYATPIPLFIHWSALLGTAPASVDTTITNVDLAPTLCEIAGCEMGPFPNGHGVDGISFLSLLIDVGQVNRTATRTSGRLVRGGITRSARGRITGATLGREVVFEEHAEDSQSRGVPAWQGVRTTNESSLGRWVWTEYATGERELYRITNRDCWLWSPEMSGDPCQLRNLADDPGHSGVAAALAAILAAREDAPQRPRGPMR